MADRLEHLPLPPPEREPHRVVYGGDSTERRLPARVPADHARDLTAQVDTLEGELQQLAAGRRPEDSRGFLIAARFVEDSDPSAGSLSDKRSGTALVDFNEEEQRALVYAPTPKLKSLRSKIRQYADPEKVSEKTGLPRNAPLIAPLEEMKPATLVDLSDGWLRNDTVEDGTWVELWVGGGQLADAETRERRHRALMEFFEEHNLGPEALPGGALRGFAATEHDIYVVELTAGALLDLPARLPEVFRIGPPQRAVVPHMLDLQADGFQIPEVEVPDNDLTTVALLDTGVAEQHPLIEPALLAPGVSAVVGEESAEDSAGHGTRMAGLALYNNLAFSLTQGGAVSPRCRLQNVRLLVGQGGPGPQPMLERTEDGVLEAERIAVPRRVFNLALGAETEAPGGSTPWSIAVDKLAFGAGTGRLFCVAAGNVPFEGPPVPADYFEANLSAGLTSPAEAMNAITIGAITDLTTIDPPAGGRSPLAAAGQLSPCSRCDVGGRRPMKPDVVFEGGNFSADTVSSRSDKAMQLLTTSREHAIGPWLTTAAKTSAATAQAAGFTAEIWQANPDRRSQTIRGLLVHSARWTPAMETQFPDKRDRVRAVGYGEPAAEAARWSDYGRPTVIFEGQIHPLRRLRNGREMHFHDLPLPDEALAEIDDGEVELSVTLSYFAEPNETRGVRYACAGLRWRMQRPLESPDAFRKRINRLERAEGEQFSSEAGDLDWDIGSQRRERGTVQSDRARLSARELMGTRAIAVWPVQGWWEDRKIEGDPPLRYSLIITIDVGDQEVDLYTPILNAISIRTEV
jgi:hypothetical protein